MEPGDYTMAWVVYSVAALVFAWLCWRVLRKLPWRELAWLLQCWVLALLFTPSYVTSGESLMAPALLVFVMDAITVSRDAAIRSLIPLVMALAAGVLVTVVLSLVVRVWERRRRQQDAT